MQTRTAHRWPRAIVLAVLFSLLLSPLGWDTFSASIGAAPQSAAPLKLVHVGAESDTAFRVVATLIAGPTESILWDAQYKVSDGKRLAARSEERRVGENWRETSKREES